MILTSRLAQIHHGRSSVDDLPRGDAAFQRVLLPAVSEDADARARAADAEGGSTLEDGAIAI